LNIIPVKGTTSSSRRAKNDIYWPGRIYSDKIKHSKAGGAGL